MLKFDNDDNHNNDNNNDDNDDYDDYDDNDDDDDNDDMMITVMVMIMVMLLIMVTRHFCTYLTRFDTNFLVLGWGSQGLSQGLRAGSIPKFEAYVSYQTCFLAKWLQHRTAATQPKYDEYLHLLDIEILNSGVSNAMNNIDL